MPYLNVRGQIAHGRGGGLASVDNLPFHKGGVGGWLDADTVVFANGDDGWVVSSYHLPTRVTRRLLDVGCNESFAGGGHFASWLDGKADNPNRGIWSSTGLRVLDGGLLGVGPDASIAYKPSYQSGGPTYVRELAFDANGKRVEWQLTPNHPYQLQLLGNGRAIWWDTGTQRIEVRGIARPNLLDGAIMPHVVEMPNGELWVSSFSNVGVTLHPFGSFEGFPVVPFGTDAWHVSAKLTDDVIVVAWATGEGEQPGEIKRMFFNIRTNETKDAAGKTLRLGRVQLAPPRDRTIPKIGREMYVGCYVGSPPPGKPGGWGTDTPWQTVPGNFRITIPGGEVRRNDNDSIIGQYVEGVPDTDPAAIDRAIADTKLAHPGVPIWVYWPRQAQAQSRRLPIGASVFGMEMYRGVGETEAAFEARSNTSLVGVPKAFLIPQGYLSNTNNTPDLESIVPIAGRVARDNVNVVGIAVFNGSGRATGLDQHQDIRNLWARLFASVPGPPKQAAPMVNQPRFTISEPMFPFTVAKPLIMRCVAQLEPGAGEPEWIEWQYSEVGKDGPWTVAVRNPGFDKDHTFRITKSGTFWFRALAGNASGTHQTGAERRVVVTDSVEQSQPPTQPQQPPPSQPEPEATFFRTSDGKHRLSARVDQPGTPLMASGNGDDDFERMAILPVEGGVGILSLKNKKFLRAVNGGGGKLFFDLTTVTPDGTFTLEPGEGGNGLSIRTRTGYGFTAEQGGGGEVTARKPPKIPPQSWETFTPSRRVMGGSVLPWRMESGRFRSDDGWVVPRFYSVFHAPALVRDGNLGELRRLLDRAVAARRNGVRVFGSWHFIGGGLAPYSVDHPAWFEWMNTVIDEATARSLHVELSYFCDAQVLVPDRNRRIQLFEACAQWAGSKPALLVTAANEARKNGWREADDADLLDLVRRFKSINRTTLLGASDPLDSGQEGQSNEAYDGAQRKIGQSGVDFLLIHPDRKPRFDWVDHLYGSSKTPDAVGFAGPCWIQEPKGGASVTNDRRDGSTIAHIAAECVGAMVGAYTYMHRQLEDDVCPGLLESAVASDIPGSPDYKFFNSSLGNSPIARFTDFSKCRTISNGSSGWAVVYGAREGTLEYAPGWREVSRQRWAADEGVCILTKASR